MIYIILFLMTYIRFHTFEIKSLVLLVFSPATSKALEKVMTCQCPYGGILGVLEGNGCSFIYLFNYSFSFRTDVLVKVADMYMVEDRDIEISA